MMLARENNLEDVFFEVDNKLVFDAVKDSKKTPWRLYSYVLDIKAIIPSFKSTVFNLVNHSANNITDWIACQAKEEMCSSEGVEISLHL